MAFQEVIADNMTDDVLDDLVRDALYFRRIERSGSFVENSASLELRSKGASGLLAVESEIRRSVVPEAADLDFNGILQRFPGLLSLWTTYFHLADASENLENAAEFVSATEGPLLISALRGMRSTWNERQLPNNLRRVLEDAMTCGDENVIQAARQLLNDLD